MLTREEMAELIELEQLHMEHLPCMAERAWELYFQMGPSQERQYRLALLE
jgi:hypothetical protein